jgi:ribosomal protein S18 acetylase RimI-like enzyme
VRKLILTITTEILEPKIINVEEIVAFTVEAEKHLPVELRCGASPEAVEKFIRDALDCKYYFLLAREDGNLVGWAGLYAITDSMVYLDSWHPLVLPGPSYEEVFRLLVKESIKHTQAIGRDRLEVFLMRLTDENRATYDRVGPLYESAGMRQGGEWSQMWRDLTKGDLEEPKIPEGFHLRKLSEVKNEDIWPCYNATFLSSEDERYLGQTEEQRRENFDEFFDRTKPIEEDGSILLYTGDRIIGFMKINLGYFKDGGFINGVGIHPDFRRRGLARLLMTASMVRAAKNGMKHLVLEVDTVNHQAIALYEKLGFVKRRGSISHLWTA